MRLVASNVLSLTQAVAYLTVAPAAVMGIAAGSLHVGSAADICIFDPDAQWTLSPEHLNSRGRNTPFGGQPFTGRVSHTLLGGEVVYEYKHEVSSQLRDE